MACSCGKRAAQNAAGRAAGVTYVYDFTAPNSTETIPYGTALEGKQAVRRAGGGKLVRRAVNTTPPATA